MEERAVSGVRRVHTGVKRYSSVVVGRLTIEVSRVRRVVSCGGTAKVPVLRPRRRGGRASTLTRGLNSGRFRRRVLSVFGCVVGGDHHVRTGDLFSCGVFLVNFVNTKGDAMTKRLGSGLRVSHIRVSRVVIRGHNVSVSRVFSRFNRTCFEGLRDGALVRLRGEGRAVISYNNNIIVERRGTSRVGGGNHMILLATGPRAVCRQMGGDSRHPVLGNGVGIRCVDNLVRGQGRHCRTITSMAITASNGGIARVYRRVVTGLVTLSGRRSGGRTWCEGDATRVVTMTNCRANYYFLFGCFENILLRVVTGVVCDALRFGEC